MYGMCMYVCKYECMYVFPHRSEEIYRLGVLLLCGSLRVPHGGHVLVIHQLHHGSRAGQRLGCIDVINFKYVMYVYAAIVSHKY